MYYCLLHICVKAKESWEMDLNEKVDLAPGVKSKGNQYFKVFLLDFGRKHSCLHYSNELLHSVIRRDNISRQSSSISASFPGWRWSAGRE